MPELPAIEICGEDALHHRPSEMPLECVKPQGRLVVADEGCRGRPVSECGCGLDVGLGVVTITRQPIAICLPLQVDIPNRPRYERSEEAQHQVVSETGRLEG